jgi:hypothetical protein
MAQVVTVLPVAHPEHAAALRLVLKQVEEFRYQWITDSGKLTTEIRPRDQPPLQSASLSSSPQLKIAEFFGSHGR